MILLRLGIPLHLLQAALVVCVCVRVCVCVCGCTLLNSDTPLWLVISEWLSHLWTLWESAIFWFAALCMLAVLDTACPFCPSVWGRSPRGARIGFANSVHSLVSFQDFCLLAYFQIVSLAKALPDPPKTDKNPSLLSFLSFAASCSGLWIFNWTAVCFQSVGLVPLSIWFAPVGDQAWCVLGSSKHSSHSQCLL